MSKDLEMTHPVPKVTTDLYGISSKSFPNPFTGCRTCSRFSIDQTRAGTGCTTGTCKSQMNDVEAAPPGAEHVDAIGARMF